MRPFDRPCAATRVVIALSSLLSISAIVPAGAQSAARESSTRGNAQSQTIVVVMPFEFAAPVPARPRAAPPHRPVWPPMLGQPSGIGRAPYFAPHLANGPAAAPTPPPAAEENGGQGDAIGIGVADLLVERLLAVSGFRVVERRRLDLLLNEQRLGSADSLAPRDASAPSTLLRARYVITGSVTRFSTEDRRGLGGLGGAIGLGALGLKRPKTQVSLTARVIDAITGEVVASVSGSGTSTKGGSVLIAGVGGGVGGGVAITSGEFRASALGEATQKAVDSLVEAIVAQRARME